MEAASMNNIESVALEQAPATNAMNPPSNPSEPAKLFIGGVDDSVTEAMVHAYFSMFGEVKNLKLLRNEAKNCSRGFGFLEFADAASAARALEQPQHVIGQKTVEVKRATPKDEQRRNNRYHHSNFNVYNSRGLSNNTTNNHCLYHCNYLKIFVGGLPHSLAKEEFKEFFEQFGRVTDDIIMHDSHTGRPRGFGFITFDSVEAVHRVLQNEPSQYYMLGNKKVEVKIAEPKPKDNRNGNENTFNGFDGSMGGGEEPIHNYAPSAYSGYYGSLPVMSIYCGPPGGYGAYMTEHNAPFSQGYYGINGYGGLGSVWPVNGVPQLATNYYDNNTGSMNTAR